MASNSSFDITTGCDLQEVDNAINQARKELGQRYDFRNVKFSLDFDREAARISLEADEEFQLVSIWDVLQGKLIRRNVPIKNLTLSDAERAAGNRARQEIELQQGISGDTAKEIVKFIKSRKLKKITAAIQQDQVRVTSPSRDALQDVMKILGGEDFGIELTFGNRR